MASAMTHLNGNILCAVDVETTGFLAGKHDIIEIAVLPLDSDIKPLTSVLPFHLKLQPKRPENADKEAMRVHGFTMADLMLNGCDPWKAADLLVEWFATLELAVDKRIVPLAQNWQFDKSFVMEWLGPETYNLLFHYHYRDSMIAALYLNDRADFHAEKIPYPKVSLKYLCSTLKVQNERAHSALYDCVSTAEVYRRLLTAPTM